MSRIADHFLIQFADGKLETFDNSEQDSSSILSSTHPLYFGMNRKFRHNLDRVTNGHLPSDRKEAKSQLLEIENSYEAFFHALMPIESADDLLALRNWTAKTNDCIDDILKIIDDADVIELAEELRGELKSVRRAAGDAVSRMRPPNMRGLGLKRFKAIVIFTISIIGLPGILAALHFSDVIHIDIRAINPDEAEEVLGTFFACWLGIILVGTTALSRSHSLRDGRHAIVQNQRWMKDIIEAWD